MLELLPRLAPILAIDILNPVLFAVLIYASGTARPVLNSSALLLGHTVAYFSVGVVASFGVGALVERLANPEPLDFGFQLVLGLALIYAALSSRDGAASEERQPEGQLTPVSAFGFGAVVNFIGVPFALPYVAVIDQILRADVTVVEGYGLLVIYNLAYALPFALVPLLVAIMGQAAAPLLARINAAMVRGADLLMPWLLFLLGGFLVVDAIYFFSVGQPLPL